MFNRSEFNLITYNRPLYSVVFGDSSITGLGYIYPYAVYETIANILMVGKSTLEFTISEKGEFFISGIGGISIEAVKELYGNSLFEGIGNIYSTSTKYEVKAITFSGSFTVGDVIVVDMDKYTVTLNGVNALNNISGNFFNLLPGQNEITYTDDSTDRTVKIIVTYRDRWL